MAKEKPGALADPTGKRVAYQLTAEDARTLNERRPDRKRDLQAGERVTMRIDYDHGGDCVDGVVAAGGVELLVERRNRGFGQGQWDWNDRGEATC